MNWTEDEHLCSKISSVSSLQWQAGPLHYRQVFSVAWPLNHPPQAAFGVMWGKVWVHVLRTQVLKRRSCGSQPSNAEGARGEWQTDKQKDRLSAHHSLITKPLCIIGYQIVTVACISCNLCVQVVYVRWTLKQVCFLIFFDVDDDVKKNLVVAIYIDVWVSFGYAWFIAIMELCMHFEY